MSVRSRARATLDALEHLVGGLGTAILAVVALTVVLMNAIACLVGVGLPALPGVLRGVRAVADRERARLSRWGPDVLGVPPVPDDWRAALADWHVRRELAWLVIHATLGFGLGLLGLALPLRAVQDLTFPLWYRLLPQEGLTSSIGLWRIDSFAMSLTVAALGVGWLVLVVALGPAAARLQAWTGRTLLAPDADADLALRVAELTATRAAALDAHAAELRRIERALHDGTQNRIVAVNVLLGAARRAVQRDPALADEVLGRAQDSAEQALAELRAVVRSILPPVLTDRSLAAALAGLAADCPVPCRVETDMPERCAASVEATAYFAVAEALTNVAKHSGARHAAVSVRRSGDRLLVRVTDDGRGGADTHAGSGLVGIRRRAEAHDGTLTVSSPPGGPTTVDVSLPCGS